MTTEDRLAVDAAPRRRWRPDGGPRAALLRFVAREYPAASALLTATIVAAAALPVAIAIGVGLLVGSIPEAAAQGIGSPAYERTLTWLGVVAVLFLVQQSLPPLQEAISEMLGVRVTARLGDRVMRAALRPAGIGHLEDPGMLDRIARAQSLAPTDYAPLYAVPALAAILSTTAAAVASAAVLVAFAWWAPAVLLAARFTSRALARRRLFRISEAATDQTRALRRAKYLRELAITPGAAKELRVFGLAGWLSGRFTAAWGRAMREVWQRRGRSGRVVAAVLVPPLIADLAVLVSLGFAFAGGALSLAEFVTFVQAVVGMAGLALLSTQDTYAEYGSRPVPAVLELETAVRRLPGPAGGLAVEQRPSSGIRLKGVRFRYAGASDDVLSGVDLDVPAGRSLAVVGVNGAGKTTLVKLLARLHDPSSGRIEVDGTDLRDLDPRAWQRNVAGIFQDFVHYDLSIRDNITLGAPHLAADEDLLLSVAERAGVLPVVSNLPHGWDTVLNRLHSKGADLSGGQWQRVAIGRALFAVAGGARVLVLDEPTANLDVRAEADLYTEFLQLTSGITTILISHRFATVRQAERICVLDGGGITELGTHDELMDLDGRYAAMFRLQADAFQADAFQADAFQADAFQADAFQAAPEKEAVS